MRGEAAEHAAGVCHEDPQQVGDAQAVSFFFHFQNENNFPCRTLSSLVSNIGLYCYEDPLQIGDAQAVGI